MKSIMAAVTSGPQSWGVDCMIAARHDDPAALSGRQVRKNAAATAPA